MPKSGAPSCSPREAASWIVDRLIGAGYRALFAGGSVRDGLLGLDVKDYDVATDAHPEDVRDIFPHAHRVGEAFGVMLVRRGGNTIEVATFRADGPYTDGRRPDTIEFTTPELDAQRRDFTINGLFEDPATGEIIDHVGGRADLEAGVIRAIGDPEDRFAEDRLRMLRAVRFAARLGFTIEARTRAAIRVHAAELGDVSRERTGQEIRWMLAHPTRLTAVRLLHELQLDGPVLAEPPVDCTAFPQLEALPERASVPLALAAWILDRRGLTAGVDDPGPACAGVAAALVLSNAESDGLATRLRLARAVRGWKELSIARRKRTAGPMRAEFEEALALVSATSPDVAVAVAGDLEGLERTGLTPPPLVSGEDLIGLGRRPGPGFAIALDTVYDAQLEGRVTTRAEALALLGELGE